MAYIRQSLRVGDLAYYDSMSGPVPCRVEAIRHEAGPHKHGTFWASSFVLCDLRLTAARGAFKRGELLRGVWSLHAVPRKALRANRIMPYDVAVPETLACPQ